MTNLKYTPIDYTIWNFEGTGRNLRLSPIEQEIWDRALQFQDSRKGEKGHAEVVTYFALKLLGYHPQAGRDVVVSAAILHDVGWSQLTEIERRLFYEMGDDGTGIPIWKRYEQELRQRHQEQGVKKAGEILDQCDSPLSNRGGILEIISEHDTRKGFLNVNDGLMRDADKLWRFTLLNWKMELAMRGYSPEDSEKYLLAYFDKPGFFYSRVSEQIARIELRNTLKTYEEH